MKGGGANGVKNTNSINMENNSEKIIMTTLREERDQLEMILTDPDHDFHDERLERIINWANDLLMNASENEPGQVNLIPLPVEQEEPKKENQRGEHQSIGSGPYEGPHIVEL